MLPAWRLGDSLWKKWWLCPHYTKRARSTHRPNTDFLTSTAVPRDNHIWTLYFYDLKRLSIHLCFLISVYFRECCSRFCWFGFCHIGVNPLYSYSSRLNKTAKIGLHEWPSRTSFRRVDGWTYSSKLQSL